LQRGFIIGCPSKSLGFAPLPIIADFCIDGSLFGLEIVWIVRTSLGATLLSESIGVFLIGHSTSFVLVCFLIQVTGGGGYTKENVARCWTVETGVLVDTELPNGILEISVVFLHEDSISCESFALVI